MTKLLDYGGFFKDSLEEDTGLSVTSDLPYLRYTGPHYVFLWDENRDHKNHDKVFGSFSKYNRVSVASYTTDSYLPFRNKTNGGEINHFLPHGIHWPSIVKGSENLSKENPLPLVGCLLEVSISALQRLDAYYSNSILTLRQKISVKSSGKEYKAWSYFTPIHSLCKYDPHERKYSMGSGVEIAPCKKVGGAGAQRFVGGA